MEGYQKRMLEEREELSGRIERLSDFIDSARDGEVDVSDEHYDMMLAQVYAMHAYRSVLDLRIADLGIVDEG